MKAITHAGTRIAVAALGCAALLLPGAAQASAGPAATARPAITVYVVSQGANTVTPISAATNKPGRPFKLPAGGFPTFMVITPNGKGGYIFGSSPRLGVYMVPVNTATSRAMPAIPLPLPGGAADAAFSPDSKTGYITGGSGVTPIVTATGRAGRPIKVSPGPCEIAITPDGKTVYVAHNNGPEFGDTVTPISIATGKAGRDIRVGSFPIQVLIAP